MMRAEYPLSFERSWHPALWGGESWEVSVHSAGPSIIANGVLKGERLDAVCPEYPLLIKVIEAKTRLSVQVHPSERTAPFTGGEPKTEMWCMLDDGFIYAGLKLGTKPAEIEEAVKSGEFERLMVRHDAKKGDCFFIPGGLVHAIGDNARIYEVQQSSNTTFRLYDWNRKGADGKPRELHVAKSLQAIDYDLPPPEARNEISCRFFNFRKRQMKAGESIAAESGLMAIYDTIAGTSVLVPPESSWTAVNDGEVFITDLP